jgi:N-formylglutamate amidohydrolase
VVASVRRLPLIEDLEFPTCTIIDAHSFPDEPMPWELDADPSARPDICLGWTEHHTPEAMRRPLVEFFASRGLSVLENRRFAGRFVPRGIGREETWVWSVMVEVAGRLYWREDAGEVDPEGVRRMREVLGEAFVLVDALTGEIPVGAPDEVAGQIGDPPTSDAGDLDLDDGPPSLTEHL